MFFAMDWKKEFEIPLIGIKSSVRDIEYVLDPNFFSHYESEDCKRGHFNVNLVIEKRPYIVELFFKLRGAIETNCDRCLEKIKLPAESEFTLMLKPSEEFSDEEVDVWFIPKDASSINVADLLYEYAVLSIPIIKVYDCEKESEPPCNFEMLDFGVEPQEENHDNPFSKVLKNIKINK
jgi:uncharacterized metal-binding protein YceD (DUF177 family)